MDPKNKQSASEKISQRSSNIEEQIMAAQKKREEKLFLEELGKRISIARDGKMAMEKGDYATSLSSYRRFLTLTAKAAKVELDGLNPSHFDEKNRASESILISAIFLDLMKMLDKVSSAGAKQERATYHKLFVRFTVGQPFQGFAAENLRKYINSSKTLQNKKEFMATYRKIQNTKFCVVATWAFEDEDALEVERLRRFRDQVLTKFAWGDRFIHFYYLRGPEIARMLERLPFGKKMVRFFLRKISIFL